MVLRIVWIGLSLIFAFFVIFASIFRTSQPNYAFYQPPSTSGQAFQSGVAYYFPSPGITPDNKLWFLKAFRDKLWLTFTPGYSQKADLLLLFADKRLGMASELVAEKKSELAVTTVIKAEQYLRDAYDEQAKARKNGEDTTGFVQRLAVASLKHREIIEQLMIAAPEDARSVIVEALNTPKAIYEKCSQDLNEKGVQVPGSPF